MSSRGPLMLLIAALGILALGVAVYAPQLLPCLQPYARSRWAFPVFCAAVSAAAILLAIWWHHDLNLASGEGKLAQRREFEQRTIAQEGLIERQQWHRSLFEDNGLVMLLIDPETTDIVDANAAAAAFYGYSHEELRQMSICQISMLPRARLEEILKEIVAAGTRRFTFQHRRADGSFRDVGVVSGPLLTQGRTLVFAIVQDLTAQIQAEESVRRIINASPMGFHMFRLEGEQLVFAGYNRAADEILHTSHEPMVGRDIDELYNSPEMRPVAACYRDIARNGGRWSFENFQYTDQNVTGIFDVSAFQVSPGNMVAMITDATERYRHEELLARSERRFRLLYEYSPVGIATIELPSLLITSANPAFQDILGYSEADLQNRRFDTLPVPDADDMRQLGPESFSIEHVQTIQRRYLCHDGGHVWVELTLCAVPAEDETGLVGLAILRDITQRRIAEEQLRHAKQAAERANAAKDQFLAALSHELRTPLTPVLLTTQSLQMDPNLADATREDLATIQRNVELEARLIDDLLDLTRIARGKLQLHTTRMNIHECIRYAVDNCLPEAQKKHIRPEVWLDAGRSLVLADASRMQQVFWNLIKNAIKFTPPRGLVVVRTYNDRSPESPEDCPEVVCEVVDNGVGMDAETLGRIFIPFEQGSAQVTRLFGGLGMGLSITKAIVELHGGCIDANSMGPGRGSVFTVRFRTVLTPELPEPAAFPEPLTPERPLTVLLVEDHEATARVLARLLTGCGYRVISAGDVATATKLAAEHTFDLLISDLGLPDGTGMDLVRHLKKTHPVPAIAVSGYGMEQDVRNSLQAGFQEHLIKPVNVDRLRQAITRVTAKAVTV